MTPDKNKTLVDQAIQLSLALISNNKVEVDHIPAIFEKSYQYLQQFHEYVETTNQACNLSSDHFRCLICDKKVVLLNKHLKQHHNINFETYQNEFNLSSSYPKVPISYSQKRSAIAKNIKLGKTHSRKREKKG